MIIRNGYQKIRFFGHKDIDLVIKKISNKLNNLQKIAQINEKNIHLLHKINFSKKNYKKIIQTKNRNFFFSPDLIKQRVNKSKVKEILNKIWGHNNFKIVWIGSPKRKEFRYNRIAFRLARPKNKFDVAGEHIDSYNNEKNYFFTIWVPIIGFNKKYSLKIYPKTHSVNHDKNVKKYNKKNSRLFKKGYLKKFKEKRFSLRKGDALIFDQNLIHGGAINNGNKTRLSIEIRIFNKKKFNKLKLFSKKI
tara:strand:+ start:1308 stop:2051 length:744 start_codon:yes stop_codon:yes gene_type:complete